MCLNRTLSLFRVFLLFGTINSFISCSTPNVKAGNLKLDHILLFVKDDFREDLLYKELFSPALKLTTDHKEQGTKGNYILFLNTYIEFLYLEDSSKILANETRFRSPYLGRWNTATSCPFSFGLMLEPFDTSTIEFPFELYRSLDMPEEEFYIMPSYNKNLKEPLIYISMPHRAHKSFESIEAVNQKADEAIKQDLKNYLTHPSSIKKLTQVILTIPPQMRKEGNIKLLEQVENLEIKSGEWYELLLVFDNHEQGKEFLIESDLNIRINY